MSGAGHAPSKNRTRTAADVSPAAQPRFEPFRLRGANFNLLVLRLLDARPEVIVPALGDQFRRAPGFLRFAPIVIGLDDISAAPHEVDFARLVAELRNIEIMPIGTTGGTPEMRSLAQSAGLPPLRAAGGREEDVPVQQPAPQPPPQAPAASAEPRRPRCPRAWRGRPWWSIPPSAPASASGPRMQI
ncbi:hypothetical protein ACFQU7_04520 [Pseudoroseomonas wenyumeiae]